MAKKKAVSSWTDVTDSESSFDPVFTAMAEEAKRRYPGNVLTGGEEAMHIICLPVPSFAIRFLLQQEGWPLGRFTMVVGPEESFKSTLGYEIMRWHRVCRGNGVYIPTEVKTAPEMMLSIMNWDEKAFIIQKAGTLEDWYRVAHYWVKRAQLAMDGDGDTPGRGRSFPICYLVDSLTAVLDKKQRDKIDKDGVPEKHFSTQASFMSDFMKYFPRLLTEYPFSFVGINHLTPTQDSMGNEVRHVPGGKAPRYHESLELEMKRRTPVKKAGEKGMTVEIKVMKNSNAPHEKVLVDVIWFIDHDNKDPTTGHPRQRTFFDWDSASIDILDRVPKEFGAKHHKALKEVIDLTVGDSGRVICPELGIPKSKTVTMREAGQLLEAKLREDVKFRDALYPLMGIRRRHMFQSGVDFLKQVEEAVATALAGETDQESPMPPFPEPDSGRELTP